MYGEHRSAITSNDANQPFRRYFNNDSHCVSDMKIRALCPISGSNNSCKRHEMSPISKLGTVHPLNAHTLIGLRLCFLPHFVLCICRFVPYHSMQCDLNFLFTLCFVQIQL